MKKKLFFVAAAMTLVFISGCGNNASTDEGVQETVNMEGTAAAADVETGAEEETAAVTDEENEAKEAATPELESNPEGTDQEDMLPAWYMDSEGIKSDTLGLVIRKDNAVFDELSLGVNFGVTSGGITSQVVFDCDYYEGDLDSYISEHNGMEKAQMEDISYAYTESEESSIKEIVFAGNGVIIRTYLLDDNKNAEDYLEYLHRINLVKTYSEAPIDCLAYIADDGIYCPALGIMLSTNGTSQGVNSIWVKCNKADYSASIKITDESITGCGVMYYMADAKNAQEVVDKYVEGAIEPSEYKTVKESAIEGTDEINVGNYKFLGRGVIQDWEYTEEKDEAWLFYSDETTWSISIDYDEGNQYKDYVGVIENLAQ